MISPPTKLRRTNKIIKSISVNYMGDSCDASTIKTASLPIVSSDITGTLRVRRMDGIAANDIIELELLNVKFQVIDTSASYPFPVTDEFVFSGVTQSRIIPECTP